MVCVCVCLCVRGGGGTWWKDGSGGFLRVHFGVGGMVCAGRWRVERVLKPTTAEFVHPTSICVCVHA